MDSSSNVGAILAADVRAAMGATATGRGGNEAGKSAQVNKNAVHLMPCRIHHDGFARVSEYFHPQLIASAERGSGGSSGGATSEPLEAHEEEERKKKGGLLEASFHGRRLVGKTVAMPEGVTGVVLRQQVGGFRGANNVSNFAVTEDVFDEFVYWNHDVQPTDQDHVPKSFQWFDIAKALHAPIEEEEDAVSTAQMKSP